MSETRQFVCECCGIIFEKNRKRNYKFCGVKCGNSHKGKIIHEQNKNKKACDVCGEIKIFGDFSPIEKYDISKGRRDTCKKCSRNTEERKRRSRTWKDDARAIMLMNSKARAKRAGMEFDLCIEDIIIPDKCPVLGIDLHTGDKKNWVNSPSIDRIDNNIGYIKDNIVVVSRRANILKKDATKDELFKMYDFYKQYDF